MVILFWSENLLKFEIGLVDVTEFELMMLLNQPFSYMSFVHDMIHPDYLVILTDIFLHCENLAKQFSIVYQ